MLNRVLFFKAQSFKCRNIHHQARYLQLQINSFQKLTLYNQNYEITRFEV
jgi:hypothetical protein